jgi:hypothetical protein
VGLFGFEPPRSHGQPADHLVCFRNLLLTVGADEEMLLKFTQFGLRQPIHCETFNRVIRRVGIGHQILF